MQQFSIPKRVAEVINRLTGAGFEAYLVGGCVRDMLMGDVPKDWDVTTAALTEEVIACFGAENVLETGIQHGTVTVKGEPMVEVTTFRTDGAYSDNRRPDSVSFVRSLEEDLKRRDFTINAMAMDVSGEVIDLFGGREDIAHKTLRAVGEADRRFNEDALRILRALRFSSWLGFRPEEKTAESMHNNRQLLTKISAERVFSELKGILCGEYVKGVLMEFSDILSVIIPEISQSVGFPQKTKYHRFDVWEHTAHAVEAVSADPRLRMAMLLHDAGKPAHFTAEKDGTAHFYGHAKTSVKIASETLKKLKAPTKFTHDVLLLVKHHDDSLPQSDAAARRFLAKFGSERAQMLIEVHRADALAQALWLQEKRHAKISVAEKLVADAIAQSVAISLKDLAISGSDLIALGINEGEEIGKILAKLLERVIDNPEINTREALTALALEQAKSSR